MRFTRSCRVTTACEARLDPRDVQARQTQSSTLSPHRVVATCVSGGPSDTLLPLQAPTRPHTVRRAVLDTHLRVRFRRKRRSKEISRVAFLVLEELLQSVLPWRRAHGIREANGCLKHALSHMLLKMRLPVVPPVKIANNPSVTAALHPIKTSHHISQLLDRQPDVHPVASFLHLQAPPPEGKRRARCHPTPLFLVKALARPLPVPPYSNS